MKPFYYNNGVLRLIDQTKLPLECTYVECRTYSDVAHAIKSMLVRGAPAIGICAAYGIAIGVNSIQTDSKEEFINQIDIMCDVLRNTRPTAVNLFWAIERIYKKAVSDIDMPIHKIKDIIMQEAENMNAEDIKANKSIGAYGNQLIKCNSTILTHCNAGTLATCDYGTALGVIRAAHQSGKSIKVLADETRPYLQGSRLTAWELQNEGIPVFVICDNMAGHFMKQGAVDCVIVGADRIAKNGDTANKIGTYSLSVLAKENKVPFYVAAPLSTIDLSINSGEEIPIEERNPNEVTHIKGIRIAPHGVSAMNPAFDVTPNEYISAIITEKGLVYPPFEINIPELHNAK